MAMAMHPPGLPGKPVQGDHLSEGSASTASGSPSEPPMSPEAPKLTRALKSNEFSVRKSNTPSTTASTVSVGSGSTLSPIGLTFDTESIPSPLGSRAGLRPQCLDILSSEERPHAAAYLTADGVVSSTTPSSRPPPPAPRYPAPPVAAPGVPLAPQLPPGVPEPPCLPPQLPFAGVPAPPSHAPSWPGPPPAAAAPAAIAAPPATPPANVATARAHETLLACGPPKTDATATLGGQGQDPVPDASQRPVTPLHQLPFAHSPAGAAGLQPPFYGLPTAAGFSQPPPHDAAGGQIYEGLVLLSSLRTGASVPPLPPSGCYGGLLVSSVLSEGLGLEAAQAAQEAAKELGERPVKVLLPWYPSHAGIRMFDQTKPAKIAM